MSEGNGKVEKKRFKTRKSQVVEIEDESGNVIEYTLKQMMGDDLTAFEKFRKPLMDKDDKPIDGAADAIASRALALTMFAPNGEQVSPEFLKSLSVEAKTELFRETMLLTGGTAAAKALAKNESETAVSGAGTN